MIHTFDSDIQLCIPSGWEYVRIDVPKKYDWYVPIRWAESGQPWKQNCTNHSPFLAVIVREEYKWPEYIKDGTWLYYDYCVKWGNAAWYISSIDPGNYVNGKWEKACGSPVPRQFDSIMPTNSQDQAVKYCKRAGNNLASSQIIRCKFDYWVPDNVTRSAIEWKSVLKKQILLGISEHDTTISDSGRSGFNYYASLYF